MNQDIVNVIKAYENALNASNTAACLALYGDDPIFMPQYSAALSGREAVKAGYDHVFNTLKLDVIFTVHEAVEMGHLAYVRTTSAGHTEILAKNRVLCCSSVKDYRGYFLLPPPVRLGPPRTRPKSAAALLYEPQTWCTRSLPRHHRGCSRTSTSRQSGRWPQFLRYLPCTAYR